MSIFSPRYLEAIAVGVENEWDELALVAEDLAATISAGAESEPALEDLDADSLVETAEEAESPAGETPEEEEV